MTEREDTPRRKAAPDITVAKGHVDIRKQILDELDAKNPDFVHSYQKPEAVTGDKTVLWEMEVKRQEVVKGEKGNVIHHMGDPVVRRPRKDWEYDRQADASRSKDDVEAVVKPERSTVTRSPKTPVVTEKKKK